jgi:hypothetical protein
MVHRAADYHTALEVFVAVELARGGAASVLIERLTGFGARWVRSIVRENGGALALKSKDPLRWFEEHPMRLLHARYVQMAYERQPANDSIGRRLLNTYGAYRRVVSSASLLDINECAQVIDLCQSGNAWVRECTECQQKHLVLTERTLCPICRLMAREFCRGCRQLLPATGSPLRAYCDTCSPRAVRLALRRRSRRGVAIVAEAGASRASLPAAQGALLIGS